MRSAKNVRADKTAPSAWMDSRSTYSAHALKSGSSQVGLVEIDQGQDLISKVIITYQIQNIYNTKNKMTLNYKFASL